MLSVQEGLALGLPAEKIYERSRAALGLATSESVPGSAFGRLLLGTGEGASTASWEVAGRTLARTASTADYAADMLSTLRAEGYTHKRWSTRYDSKVRDSHVAADRSTVLLEESFIVGGTALRFPGDPEAADRAETVNCRCVLIGVRY